jgi:hypothetical protein
LVPHSQFVLKSAHRSREVSVSKQRAVVCVVAACLVAALAPACVAGYTKTAKPEDPCELIKSEPTSLTNCRRSISERDALLYGGYLRDGLVHFRVAYDYDVEPAHRKAFQGAMSLWNAHRHETGFAFEDATSAIVDLRLQRGAPTYEIEIFALGKFGIDAARIRKAEKDNCAEHVSAGSFIWYSPTGMNWLMSMPADWLTSDIDFLFVYDPEFLILARIYAHELGHALGINHKTTGVSVMRGGDKGIPCREVGLSVVADIQPDDLLDARHCACNARQNLREPGATRRP